MRIPPAAIIPLPLRRFPRTHRIPLTPPTVYIEYRLRERSNALSITVREAPGEVVTTTMNPGYIWLIATVFLLMMEMVTPGTFFMAALAVGTVAGGITAFLVPETPWAWWLAFCLVSAITVTVCRRLVTRLDTTPTVAMNVDALVGRTALVIQPIDAAGNSGRVRVDGDEWRAVADREIPDGEEVEVKEVRGTRLFVTQKGGR